MDIFEFYKTSGIDLKEHNGSQFYALRPDDAFVLLDLLDQDHVTLHSIDVMCKNENGQYDYLRESGKSVNWDLDSEGIASEQRYEVVKQKIEALNTIADKDNLAFLFSDEKSYKAWKKNHQKWSA
ncbi:MAG: hypothetical protein PHQ90_06310 [Sulfuricurvum sp.]|uniref:hypothetical protein n=1 Tax=Sulfuricurvum sp. TaxID=2025608 RepID=UPI0026209A3D|nr:hypothetical protein [Sulfuricurvum sp.]MDD2368898.1 hypothetical protein [Sulfuricurvum sp.]MDD5118495.1 hypothetical protein [Sulfuricurvum sp.]